MTSIEQQAIDILRKLTPESLERVIRTIQESMPIKFDPESDPEIARRIEEIKSGKVECIPHHVAMKRLRDLG